MTWISLFRLLFMCLETRSFWKPGSLPCLSLSDELLQEQRADMDQFTSSIAETPVDVRVSSEESDEIPPFHPFHSFPSLSENEGAYDWQHNFLVVGLGERGRRMQVENRSQSFELRLYWGGSLFLVRDGQRKRDSIHWSPTMCRHHAGCFQIVGFSITTRFILFLSTIF